MQRSTVVSAARLLSRNGAIASVRTAPSAFAPMQASLATSFAPRASSSSSSFISAPIRSFRSSAPALGNVIPFNLADIGEGILEVEVLQWYIKEGDSIKQFDKVCEVQSDKATVEISSRFDGVVRKLHHAKGAMAKVGKPLLDIEVEGAAAAPATASTPSSAPSSTPSSSPAPSSPSSSASCSSAAAQVAANNGKVLTTPAVRRIARENGLDLSQVPATGKGGRVLKEDVLSFMEGGSPAPAASASASVSAPLSPSSAVDRVEPIRGLKRTMVKTMTASISIPHFGYGEEITMDALVQLRADLKATFEKRGTKLSYMPFIIKAASLALRSHPVLNSSVNESVTEIIYKGNHNIGVAMDTPSGLLVPNIKSVQDRSIYEIAVELNRLQKLGAEGKLSTADLTGGTFSLSNIGSIGGTYCSPVINGPEVAIGALGRIQKLPRFDKNGNVFASNIMVVSWAADHRIVDGATMANFSNQWKGYLENPMHFLMDMK